MTLSGQQLELTDDGFGTEIDRSVLPVLVEFWAEWSGGCHIMAPILESLAKSLAGRINVMRMNIEQCPRTASRFGVRGVPSFLLFRRGELVDLVSGILPRSELAKRVARNLDDSAQAKCDESSTRGPTKNTPRQPYGRKP
jgi:thioredoxin 1